MSTRNEVHQHRVVAVQRGLDHIEKIRVTDTTGTKMEDWTAQAAACAIGKGTDGFSVTETVWSPVLVYDEKFIRTHMDGCEHSNLADLPEFDDDPDIPLHT